MSTRQGLESTFTQVQMVLVTTWARIRNCSHYDAIGAIIVLTSSGVGDLNLAATVWAWRLVLLPVVGQGDDLGTILYCNISA